MRLVHAMRLSLVLCVATAVAHASSAPATVFSISSPSPAAASAGSQDLNVSLTVQQNTTTTFQQQYGLCLYTGIPSTPVARAATSTAANPTFTIPAGDFDIPTGVFSSGQYTAYLNLQTSGTACSESSSISNSIRFILSYPTLSSVSLAAFAQPNSGVSYASYPASVELNGTNLNAGSGASFTFSSGAAGATPTFEAGRYLPAVGSVVVPVPARNEAGANGVLLSVCNTSTHYRYCSAATSLASFALAGTTTQLTSSVASPLVGQATMLSARIAPGAGSTTAGGIYVPAIPSGIVTFTDGSTTLGTAPLVASGLSFATATRQTINASSTVSSDFGARARVRRSGRPNATPSPDNSTNFTSIVADFNLDGVKDALILDQNAGKFHLLLGSSPAGNFQTEKIVASGCSYLSGATVTDLNGDGYPDIAYLCVNDDNSSSLFALYNLGDGTFAPAASLLGATGAPLTQAGSQIGSGDFNKDGKMDLVVTGPTGVSEGGSTYGVQTFLGDGAGHFTPGPVTVTGADPGTQLAVADLNNDGAADLVLLSSSYQTYVTVVQPYLNDGTGSFTAPASIPVCNCYTYTAKLFVAPLTSNAAYPDIAVAAPDSQQVLVALNPRTSTSVFGAPGATTVAGLTDAVLGDLNGDGLGDLAVFDGTGISVLNGDGAGGFAAQASSPNFASTGYSAANVSLVAATDMNQDGYADLLTIYPGATFTSTINTYLTTGSAVATLPATFSSAGSHPLATTYPGNANVLGSTGTRALTVQSSQIYTASIAITVPPGTTPTVTATQGYTPGGSFSLKFTLTQSNNPVRGQGQLSPTGNLTVSEGSNVLGMVALQASTPGISSATLANFGSATAGVHVLTIAYGGDSNFQPFSTSFTFTVTPATPTVTWVTPATINANTPLGSSLLSATASVPGSFAYTPASGYLSAGSQTITAVFTPTDAVDYQAVTTVRSINVLKVNPTSATLTVSPARYLAGTPTVLTATLTGVNLNPTGAVEFFDGTTRLGSSNLASGATIPGSATSGLATLSLATLAAGPHAFEAVYAGDTTYNSAASNTLSYPVQATPSTTLTVISGGEAVSSVAAGSVVTLTATVPSALGQVNFCDASAAFCTDIHLVGSAQLTAAGTASIRFIPAIGNHTYRAVFLGTSLSLSSSSETANLIVTGAFPTTTTLTTSGSPTSYVFTATVVGSGSPTLTPTGTVSFLDATNANNPAATAPLGTSTTTQSFVMQAASGINGRIVATADFNGDGIPDILAGTSPSTTSGTAQTASVYLGNGDGTFTLKSTLPVSVTQAVTGDFNHDGIVDLALAGSNGTIVAIYLGNGDGTFTAGSTSTVPAGSGSLLVADFNHDGILDLATGTTLSVPGSSFYTGTIIVLLGAGDGTFRSVESSVSVGASSLATADFNGDGIPDLVAGNPAGQTATIFLGTGDGTFTIANSYAVQSAPSFASGDFNGDGIADLAAMSFYDGTVTILLGRGDGSFTQQTSFSDPTAVGEPNSFNIAVGDLNGDGIADLAVTADDGISIYLGQGDGSFTMSTRAIPQTTTTEEQGHEDFGLVLADFNGDGLLDLATSAPNVTIAFNTIMATATATASGVPLVGSGSHPVTASYAGDANFAASVSAPALLTAQQLVPVLTFSPPALALTYGMPLPGSLFNATVTAPGGGAIAGAITYNHAAGDVLTAGSQTLTATFTPADLLTYTTVSVSRTLTVQPARPVITFNPNPATIVYGTAISSGQQNATVTSTYIPVVPGTFHYTFAPTVSTIPGVGVTTITAAFTPTDAIDFTTAMATATVTVTKATPTISFATSPTAVTGTPLANLQLTPTVTGVSGAALPGTVTFLPNTGLVVSGAQILTVTFTPTDSTDYNPVTTTVTLNGTPVRLTALSSSSAVLGDPAKTITLSGTGFATDSVARANGTALTTTYVSSTSLTAVLPATDFLAVQTLQITVFNPTQSQTTAALPFTVSPASVSPISFTGPTTANSGDQPTVKFSLTNPYPVSLTATLTLSFAPISGGVDDPAIQFKDGGRAFRFSLAAGQTVSPNIQLQSGTVAGTIQVTLALFITDGGANVTPVSATPFIITIAPAAPVITTTTVTRTGRQFTVNTYGLANTRAIGQATFHFTPAAGKQIQTQDITLDVTSLFSGWYSQAVSATYGSTFLYTQTFNLDDDATVIGQVTVTLSNGVGVSAAGSSE